MIDVGKIKNYFLVYIAPKTIINKTLYETNTYCQSNYNFSFAQLCNKNNIKFIHISWENILLDLDSIEFPSI